MTDVEFMLIRENHMPYLNCLNCDTRFYTRPWTIKQGFGKYCSKTCSNTHNNPAKSFQMSEDIADQIVAAYLSGKSKREAGEMFGYGRGATDKILKRKGIQARTVSAALKGRVFTDEHRQKIFENHHDMSGKNNPMYGVTSPNPKGSSAWVYVPHLNRKVRSRWEANIALALNQLGIVHEYETQRIYLGDISTLVDFYLPKHDVYLEVKGFENEHFCQVIRLMPELHPTLKYLVINQPEYLVIQKDIRHLQKLIENK